MFVLEFKYNQGRSDIMKTPYWEANTRRRQLEKYYSERNKSMNEAASSAKGSRTITPSSFNKR
jgi:hypothetical protein